MLTLDLLAIGMRVAGALAAATMTWQGITPPVRLPPIPDGPEAGRGTISRVMANADAQSFGRALAEAGYSAGFIMPASERQGVLPPDRGGALTLDQAVETFTTRNAYDLLKQGDTLVFRHRAVPADVMSALEAVRLRRAANTTVSGILFNVVLRGLARRPVADVGPEPGASPACPIESPVTIAAARASALDTLNATIGQVKGLAWLVRFGDEGQGPRLQVGYICGDGVWSALSVPGW